MTIYLKIYYRFEFIFTRRDKRPIGGIYIQPEDPLYTEQCISYQSLIGDRLYTVGFDIDSYVDLHQQTIVFYGEENLSDSWALEEGHKNIEKLFPEFYLETKWVNLEDRNWDLVIPPSKQDD